MAGLTSSGFTPKTLEEIKSEVTQSMQTAFQALGEDINTNPSSRFGQLIDIFSNEMASVWEGLEDVYNSYFPLTSFGTSLDKANSLVNISRLDGASSQAEVYLIGDSGASIPQGNGFVVTNTNNVFSLSSKTRTGTPDTTAYVIADNYSGIVTSRVATSGTIDIGFDDNYVTINWNDTPAAIKAAIEGLANITEVNIIGGFDGVDLGVSLYQSFLHIELVNQTLVDTTMQIQNNLLLNGTTAITLDFGFATATTCNLLSNSLDQIRGLKGTIVNPSNTVSGLTVAYNISDAILGRKVESDAEYRLRRYNELSRSGTSTASGIKEAVVNAIGSDSKNVSIVENDSDVPVAGVVDNMPPHSIEIFVNADTDFNDAIAQAIYDSKAAGIEAVSTDTLGRFGYYTDANGVANQQLSFSSTTTVTVYVKVSRDTNLDYPSDGDDQIKAVIVDFFNNLEIGETVYQHKLYTPVNTVDGITDVEIYLNTTGAPITEQDNISINSYETATTTLLDITVDDLTP